MRKFRTITIVFVAIVLLLTTSIIISISKFNTPNPMMSGIGLVKILFTNSEVVQIQEYPKVYLAKPDNALETMIDFMEQRGFNYLEDERMSSTLVFENEVSKNYVDFSVNAYYSKWVFRE
ncbi:MAG: hypothetical protein SCK28_12495 [Bacillota bacterium]|nr:hypothetical protein [Bacillota bacterium]